MEMFRKPSIGGLDSAWFARWWKVVAPAGEGGGVVARLNRGGARSSSKNVTARAACCCVRCRSTPPGAPTCSTCLPLRPSLTNWSTTWRGRARPTTTSTPANRCAYRLPREATRVGLTLQAPSDKEPKPLVFEEGDKEGTYAAKVVEQARGPLLLHEGMRETGIWKLTVPKPAGTPGGTQTVYYAVQPDARKADLTPLNKADRDKVGKYVKFGYENDAATLLENLSKESQRQEFWWWFLLGVIALLCSEVWFTRRLVKSRA